jgi:signal transduction histidine kinase
MTDVTDGDDIKKIKLLLEQQQNSAKLLIRRDLELTRANERLLALDQMKTDFVSVATHQLRTPLSAIKWTLSMLLKGDIGPLTNEQKTFLMKAYESNDRMVALLGDMLLSDQIESGKMRTSNSVTLLPELPENLLLELQPAALKKQVTLVFEHPAASYAPVSIDPQQLRAVLQNLLENAVKYSNEKGVVTLRIVENGTMTIFTVSDTGIGIPLESQKNIATRFFRAPNAVKMETDGSGLGLFIARSILEKHGGAIRFVSDEHVGTTFTVELPNTNNTNNTSTASTPASVGI